MPGPEVPIISEEGMPGKRAPKRTFELIRSPRIDGVGAFCVSAKRDAAIYAFCEIPCEVGGRGFAVHRLGIGNLYHVRVGLPEECSCECMGFLRHGHCRHIEGLRALIERGGI
jgi:hypothetical protein